MDFLVWLGVVNLLPIVAVGFLALRPARFAIPWLGLAVVVLGASFAFSSSATLTSDGSIGSGIGWFMSTVYGLLGMAIVIGYVRDRLAPFVALGAIVSGAIHVASFYAFLPPFNAGNAGMLVFATPGLALVAYGVLLWFRHGLAGPTQPLSLGRRLVLSLAITASLGVLGLLAYGQPHTGAGRWFDNPPDLARLADTSMLVVEGAVVNKALRTEERQRKDGETIEVRHTLYRIELSHSWRGEVRESILVAVQDFSPVELELGQPYLLFFAQMANQSQFPDHWWLVAPEQVWTVSDGGFHTYPGFDPPMSITRAQLTEAISAAPVK